MLVWHTRAMKTTTRPNGIAPAPAGRGVLGAKGGKVAQAWQYVWDGLHPTEYRDGVLLAEQAAAKLHIKTDSVRAVLHRAAAAGLIEGQSGHTTLRVERYGKVFQVKQARTFYRIAPTVPGVVFQEPQ
jgi:hypothetical protein